MNCSLPLRIGYLDTLSPLAFTLQREGVVLNLTGLTPKFIMYDEDGNVAIPLTDTGVNVSSPLLGELEYDFQTSGFDDFAAELAADPNLDEKVYYAYWKIFNGAGTEVDTYPSNIGEDAIQITIFNPAASRVEPAETIDLIAAANSPLRTRTVEGTVQERSIHELIAADRYNKSQDTGPVPWGMKIARTRPSGPCS